MLEAWPSLVRLYIRASNWRLLRLLDRKVRRIQNLERKYAGQTEAEIAEELERLWDRGHKGVSADQLEVPFFALAGDIARRVVGLQPFHVQYLAALVLRRGNIIQMDTGEGKTLLGVLHAALEAFQGRRVIVVTANEYLAFRDAKWMAPLYSALGLGVAAVSETQTFEEKQTAYAAHVVYTTAQALIFDEMTSAQVRRPTSRLHIPKEVAIIDEVDAILIDQASQPFIKSRAIAHNLNSIYSVSELAGRLNEGEDYTIDYDLSTVEVLDEGLEKLSAFWSSWSWSSSGYGVGHADILFYLSCCLWAQKLLQKDRDYLVEGGRIVLIDDFGRPRYGSAYGIGHQQALEAKEGLPLTLPTQPIARMTAYSFFRGFSTVTGMSGSAFHEAFEFRSLYGLNVVPIPPNRPRHREDLNDLIFGAKGAKLSAVVDSIAEIHESGRPVLVGTLAVDDAIAISRELAASGMPCELLTASNHLDEANIIANAGRPGAITIAAKMAGRGVDIKLGPGVAELGGLHVIGFERSSARRLDEQLQGRAGRQGDPGSSQFFISLDDGLAKAIFGGREFLKRVLGNAPAEQRWMNKRIKGAQRRHRDAEFSNRRALVFNDKLIDPYRREFFYKRNLYLYAEDRPSVDQAGADTELSSEIRRIIRSRLKALLEDRSAATGHGAAAEIEDLSPGRRLAQLLHSRYDVNVPLALSEADASSEATLDEFTDYLIGVIDGRWGEAAAINPDLERRDVLLLCMDFGWAAFLSDTDAILNDSRFRTYSRPDLFAAVAGSRIRQARTEVLQTIEQRVLDSLLTINRPETSWEVFNWKGTEDWPLLTAAPTVSHVGGAMLLPGGPPAAITRRLLLPAPGAPASFGASVNDYLADLRSKNRPPQEVSEAAAILRKFQRFGVELHEVSVHQLTQQMIVFVRLIEQEGLTRSLRRRQILVLGRFFFYLHSRGQMHAMPGGAAVGLAGTLIGIPLIAKNSVVAKAVGAVAIFLAYLWCVGIGLPFAGSHDLTPDLGPMFRGFLDYLDRILLAGGLSSGSVMALGILPSVVGQAVFSLMRGQRMAPLRPALALPFQMLAAAAVVHYIRASGAVDLTLSQALVDFAALTAGASIAHLLLFSLGKLVIIQGAELLLLGNMAVLMWNEGPGLLSLFPGGWGPLMALGGFGAMLLYVSMSRIPIPIELAGRFDFVAGRVSRQESTIWLDTFVGYRAHLLAFLLLCVLSAYASESGMVESGPRLGVIWYAFLLLMLIALIVRKRYAVDGIRAFLRKSQAVVRGVRPGRQAATRVRRRVAAAWLVESLVETALPVLLLVIIIRTQPPASSPPLTFLTVPLMAMLVVVAANAAYTLFKEIRVHLYPQRFLISDLAFDELNVKQVSEDKPRLLRIAERLKSRYSIQIAVITMLVGILNFGKEAVEVVEWVLGLF